MPPPEEFTRPPELLPLVYDELRRRAAAQLVAERPVHTHFFGAMPQPSAAS